MVQYFFADVLELLLCVASKLQLEIFYFVVDVFQLNKVVKYVEIFKMLIGLFLHIFE